MPTAVVLMSSDGTKNLSDEVYAAFTEPPTETKVHAFSGELNVTFDRMTMEKFDALPEDGDGLPDQWVIIIDPNPRSRPKPPADITLKETLDATEVEAMLNGPPGLKLAVPNGSSTDVFTRDMLAEAWAANAPGIVTTGLRGPTQEEQALLDDAKERLTPKAGAARVTAAITAPITNIALLAAAATGFIAWKGDDIARPWLAVVAAILALASVIVSLVSTHFLKTESVSLSRLDLLRKNLAALGPPAWLTWVVVGLFVLALIAAVFSIFPTKSSPAAPSPSFGEPTTAQVGTRTKVDFSVTWQNLGDDEAKVRTTVSRGGATIREVVTPKDEEGATTQELSVTGRTPMTLVVGTQAVDAENQPVGDRVEHTYNVP